MKITHIEEDTDRNALMEIKSALIRITETKNVLSRLLEISTQDLKNLEYHENELKKMIVDIEKRLE